MSDSRCLADRDELESFMLLECERYKAGGLEPTQLMLFQIEGEKLNPTFPLPHPSAERLRTCTPMRCLLCQRKLKRARAPRSMVVDVRVGKGAIRARANGEGFVLNARVCAVATADGIA